LTNLAEINLRFAELYFICKLSVKTLIMVEQLISCHNGVYEMTEHSLTLRQVGLARGDLYAIQYEIENAKAAARPAAKPRLCESDHAAVDRFRMGAGHRRRGDVGPVIDDRAWCQSSGTHCRELAGWLREIGGKCRLPTPRRELLNLAGRSELRADHLDRRTPSGAIKNSDCSPALDHLTLLGVAQQYCSRG
jgi:hypothetical protein